MKKILILITAMFLFGCNEKTYTVEDFKNNKELLDQYRKKCINGEIYGDSLNCQNSHKALILLNRPTNTGKWTD
ncbi:EexN family lipoprotein [Gilliamella sp. B2923]|uniref:EexN family lipoprotein n=2 Tax=Gilliamella TaxID=1193503 RepID=UPI00226A44C4|nr:EexN family lipoprotein [Gilliamella sp. B2923]MCX8618895.1 EexN family lipoprotein [Gilliamella sp. B2923]